MSKLLKRLGATALAAFGLLAGIAPAAAQVMPGRPGKIVAGGAFPVVQNTVSPFAQSPLQTSALRQWAFNTAVIGRTYSQLPPWLFGYNPYPPVNLGPVVQPPFPQPLYPPAYGGGYGGGYVNPYGGAGVSGYGGGYTAGGYGGGYESGYYNPYGGGDPYGGYLRGSSDTINAIGNLSLQQEQARLMRELALQAKLDTTKKAFDLTAYIRDNTPTFTQEMERIQKQTVARIQNGATMPEILSGKSLNILLKELGKYVGRKPPVAPPAMEEEHFKHLNVTRTFGNLGLLRNNGQFTWPTGLRGMTSAEERTNIEKEAQRLFRQALNANLEGESLRDLRNDIGKLRDKLSRGVNDVPASQYIDSQRFLNDFDGALVALERGDAPPYFEFHGKFATAGKNALDLVEYMTRNGLQFAPAVPGDEGAYQAAHAALVSFSVAAEGQVAGGGGKE